MKKSKKKSQHTYTSEQTEWIKDHPHLRRSELARKFNKKFETDITPIGIAKRKQRMVLEPVNKQSKKNVQRSSFDIKGETVSVKELLELIREQGKLIDKMIGKL